MTELNELERIRREKLTEIEDHQQEAYGRRFHVSALAADIKNSFHDAPSSPDKEARKESIAGRIMSWRGHGKTIFFNVKDRSGLIQVYARKDALGEEHFAQFKQLDIGDIVGVSGEIFRTQTGEITLKLADYTLLAKSLRPLPEKWHGLTDVETRYRQRYVDLIVNEKAMTVFDKRSHIIRSLRNILDAKAFHEVETPMMQAIPGGAVARPFRTHHNALNIDLYLRIAPELFLKRLLVGGMERVYEINRNFRNEGISPRHNPEFTMLEAYAAYQDYNDMMTLCEKLISETAQTVNGSMQVTTKDCALDLTPPWQRLTFHDAIRQYTGLDVSKDPDVEAEAKNLNVPFEKGCIPDVIFQCIFEEKVEPHLQGPIFITDYPATLCPLTKTKKGQPHIAERFELYIAQQEIANAYSELNHPIEQREKFEQQIKDKLFEGNVKCVDYDYIRALEYGMPPAGGLGIGIDRLVMILTGMANIRDVILFPQMRPEAVEQR